MGSSRVSIYLGLTLYVLSILPKVVVEVQGLENLVPQDGLTVRIGTFQQSNQLDLTSLSLDSECYFVEAGGYSLQLEEEDLGGNSVSVIFRMEETQCAVSTMALIPASTLPFILVQ